MPRTTKAVRALALLILSLAACGPADMSLHDASQIARGRISYVTDTPSASLQIIDVALGEYGSRFVICGVVAADSLSPRRFIIPDLYESKVLLERSIEIGPTETQGFAGEWNEICPAVDM